MSHPPSKCSNIYLPLLPKNPLYISLYRNIKRQYVGDPKLIGYCSNGILWFFGSVIPLKKRDDYYERVASKATNLTFLRNKRVIIKKRKKEEEKDHYRN